jgi:hypothetical protein
MLAFRFRGLRRPAARDEDPERRGPIGAGRSARLPR